MIRINRVPGSVLRLGEKIRGRSFLVQLVISVLVALLIPVILCTAISSAKEGEQIRTGMQAEADAVARVVCDQTETALSGILSYLPSLNHLILGPSETAPQVSEEMELIQALKYQKLSFPFLKNLGYWDSVTDALYFDSGKFRLPFYCRTEMNGDEEAFRETLMKMERGFYRTPDGSCTVYVLPMKYYSTVHQQAVALFVFSSGSMSAYMKQYLPSGYQILEITAADASVLYSDPQCPVPLPTVSDTEAVQIDGVDYMIGSASGAAGCCVRVCVRQDFLSAAFVHYSDRVRSMYITTALLCALLLLILIVINYLPVQRAVKKAMGYHIPEHETDEFSVIGSTFEKQAGENQSLTQRISEQRAQLTDYIYERLLDGKPVTPEETETVHSNMPGFCILCAKNTDIRGTDHLIRHNSPEAAVYAYDHYLSGYIVLICRVDEHHTADQARAKACTMLGEDVALGQSECSENAEDIRTLFLQAAANLEQQIKSQEHFADIQESELEEKTRQLQSAIMDFIDQHFCDADMSVISVSEAVGVGEYTAGRLLKNIYGDNFRRVINTKRLEHARELLLTTDQSVNDIGAECGFSSPSYFIKVFRDAEGVTPAVYREGDAGKN